MKSKILPFILAFSALSVSTSAAFYSITGLSKLFVGASFEVIIMASALELSKLVTASFLYLYWEKINKVLKVYLTSAVAVLVIITSMGIYGFLSSAYQESNIALQSNQSQTEFIQEKISYFESDLERYNKEILQIHSNISTLSSARATQIQVRDTSSSTGYRQTISTAELRAAQKRIEIEEANLKQIRQERNPIRDSIQTYKNKLLEIKQDTSLSSELGPLIYLSELTGKSMDSIINILLLVIIFVFDPLAISLVIAANFAFVKAFKKPDPEISKKELEGDLPIKTNKQVILEKEDTKNKVKEPKLKNTPSPVVNKTKTTANYNPDLLVKDPNLSSWKKRKIREQIQKEDNTKTY